MFRLAESLPLERCTSVSLNSTTTFKTMYSDMSGVMSIGSSVKMQLEIDLVSLTKTEYHICLSFVGLRLHVYT